jgi:2-iminobutanoate/2-iminopropanoate deaminase
VPQPPPTVSAASGASSEAGRRGRPTPVSTPSTAPLGPYSPAVRAGEWIVCSGQVGVNPATGTLEADFDGQVRRALENLANLLTECGCGWEHVAKTTLFVTADAIQWMPQLNTIYTEVLGEHRPARSTVGVASLPMGAMFEIEAWAHKEA